VEQFDLSELDRPGFRPATSIGRYLVSDAIQLERPARAVTATGVPEGLINA
jgi:D-methionine transport system ATP-binding protein